MKPFLQMRGLESGQYANDVTLLTEGELRYSIDPRWTIVGFGGGGRVGETLGDLGSAPTVGAGGVAVGLVQGGGSRAVSSALPSIAQSALHAI